MEFLSVLEINDDERIVARIAFDPEDFEAAIAELDTRYLAGEAAAHAHTWSVFIGANGATNRHETFPTTPDCLTIDHRMRTTLDADGLTAFLRASWELTPDVQLFVESVHRLSDLGAVVTHTSRGSSRDGFDAEWRYVDLVTLEGDLAKQIEIFDEADLDTALARFDELHSERPRQLENAAIHVSERAVAHFAAGEWDALAEILADDFMQDDRRRVLGAGVRHGREAQIADMREIAALFGTNLTSTPMATRGKRLVLTRLNLSNHDQGPGEYVTEMLGVGEINTDGRFVAYVSFDPDDLDAAVEELDARYLAGEAAAHAHTWSVIAGATAAFNRYEVPATTADSVYIDHRPLVSIEAVDLATSIPSVWEVNSDVTAYIEAVHQLSRVGAVATYHAHGTTPQGFGAEWRLIFLETVEGDLINRCELFDETDLDAALARFDELRAQAPPLENAASRAYERYRGHIVSRDWAAMAELLTADTCVDDRRRVVSAEMRRGRHAEIANMQAIASVGAENIPATVIATRGERLTLCRTYIFGPDQQPGGFRIEFLCVVEIDADERIAARVAFDPDDVDAAFEELDARYLAGEEAAHAHTWSVIAESCAAFNRHKLPAADLVTIDHRQLAILKATDPQGFIGAIWDVTPDFRAHIERVHRLSSVGAVATYTAYGTSKDGLDAEWRVIQLLVVEGGRITRCEIFDEADLDAALARFDELDQPPSP
jgi:hypothetical protein